ncbi:MAG: hypothetical protein HDT40_03000 [Lachnospiraceae bacterium]|nr:hypothetical protein [Lachnospiraceae bacterium]
MLKSIQLMLDNFEENNIEYCHWKSNEHIEDALRGDTDLDILFNPAQRTILEYTLCKSGLKRFRAMPLMQYNAIEDYIGFDKETAKIWHLHLHYRLSIGEKHLKGYTVPWTEYILSRRLLVDTTEGKIYCSSADDEFFLILVRMALKLRWRDYWKKIGKDDLLEIEWLKEHTSSSSVISVAEKMLNVSCACEIERLLQKNLNKKRQLYSLQKYLRAGMRRFTPYNRFTSWYRRTVRELYWLFGGIKRRMGMSSTKATRRVSPSGGTVVALLGCDGAGKSTTLAYLKKEFNKKIDVYSVYLGSGDGSSSLIRKPMKIIAKRVGGKGVGRTMEKELYEKKKKSIKARLYALSKIIWAVTLASEKRKKLKKITMARNNGLLVLVDRYPQIAVMGFSDGPLLTRYLNGKGFLKKISHWEYRIYKHAYENPPDLLVKLMVPTDIAIQRKPEMTVEEIENKKAAVRKIHTGKAEVEIDTSRDMKQSFGDVMQSIWEVI